MTLDELNSQLHWRYATKSFDPSKKVPEELVQKLLDTTLLSPSSFGLQPWRFIVITNKELRERLKPHAWNQGQITEASHLIVVATLKEMTAAAVDKLISTTATVRKIPKESLEPYRQMMLGFLSNVQGEAGLSWMRAQAYLALGNLLTACAVAGIDACPMEGFDKTKFDEILDLSSRGLATAVLCPIGYRSVSDKYAQAAKVRYPAADLVTRIS